MLFLLDRMDLLSSAWKVWDYDGWLLTVNLVLTTTSSSLLVLRGSQGLTFMVCNPRGFLGSIKWTCSLWFKRLNPRFTKRNLQLRLRLMILSFKLLLFNIYFYIVQAVKPYSIDLVYVHEWESYVRFFS